jgi:hypothetical protein
MAIGSDITNLTTEGLPDDLSDRAYAFCIGTQLLQTPSFDPRNGYVEFKARPDAFRAPLSGNTFATTAIGLATSANISQLSAWRSAQEIADNGSAYGVYAVGFAENINNGSLVNVTSAGVSIGSVAKERVGSGVSIAFDTFQSTSHGYGLGDAVVIYSGSAPAPLQLNVKYFVIPSGADAFLLAEDYAAAIAGSGIDITVSGGPVYLRSDDEWKIQRNGLTGQVQVQRNDNVVYTFANTTLASLRPFFWTRERTVSATIPVFKEIKVSGAS